MTNLIKLYPEYYQPVIKKKKRSTIRKGRKNYQLGEAVLDFGDRTLDIHITAIMLKPYGLLDDGDAIEDGFESLEDLQSVINCIYPDINPSDEMTIVFFRLNNEERLSFCPYNKIAEE
jgi:hypothetical protein